jgi:autotransporter passenger strand-loop-strand repeat protein
MTQTTIAVGETSSGAVLSNGDVESVQGTANGTIVNNDGEQYVYGVSNGTVINQGGGQVVNGTANNTVAHLGGVQIVNSGTASGTILTEGIQLVYGGLSTNTQVEVGGFQALYGGVVDGTTISSGGYQKFFDNTAVTNTVVESGGFQVIDASVGSVSISGERLMPGADLQVVNLPTGVNASVHFDGATNILSIDAGIHSYALSLVGDYTDVKFQMSQNGATTDITLCFCAGTKIRTPSGDVAVEAIRIGDEVSTLSRPRRQVRWVGSSTIIATDGNRPVIVRAGAFAVGSPCRDLRVTRCHSFLFGDVLIPIEQLVNGETILFDENARSMSLFHIELEQHDVLFAEGALAESFRDVGNRRGFGSNTPEGREAGSMPTFAPLVYRGPIVDRTRRILQERALNIALSGAGCLRSVANGAR